MKKTISKTYTHLNLSERIIIENGLNNKESFRKISKSIPRAINTVIREVNNRRILNKGNSFNMLNMNCDLLSKPPFVCNACTKKKTCRKNKYFYHASDAQSNYQDILINSRAGIDLTSDEFHNLNKIVNDDIKKGHSFFMIVNNHEELKLTARTLYNYQEKQYLSTKNIDLPRKVRYKKRKRLAEKRFKKDPAFKENRTYADWLKYKEANNISYYVQMDTVEGIKGHSALLTFTLITTGILLAFKIDNKDSTCVSDVISKLKSTLGNENFRKVFPFILTDNGTEFTNISLIEDNGPDVKETKVFFCEPYRSDQKGSLEVTHEYIRRYIPKGNSFDSYNNEDINLMINQINNVCRESKDGDTAYNLFGNKFGTEITKLMELYHIDGPNVILNNSIFKKN